MLSDADVAPTDWPADAELTSATAASRSSAREKSQSAARSMFPSHAFSAAAA